MDLLSFDVPVLGISFLMNVDFLRFRFDGDHSIVFYSTDRNDTMVGILYSTRKTHDKILQFLENVQSPISVEKIRKYKYFLSFEKTFETIQFIISMLKFLFPDHNVHLDIYIYECKNMFGRSSHHLLDLYEMGYMSLTPVVFSRVSSSFFNLYKTQLYTGLYLRATNPFTRYNNDYLEIDMSNKHFIQYSLHTLFMDRPELIVPTTAIVANVLKSIPLKKNYEEKIMRSWKNYHDLNVFWHDLSIPIHEWMPGLFLKHISRLLDMFPNYYIDHRFSIHVS